MADSPTVGSDRILTANLDALARRDPALADRIRRGGTNTRLAIVPSRSGAPTAVLRPARDAGSEVWLHSRYDPRREADRIVAGMAQGATCVCIGFGAGWVPRAYLNRVRYASVVVFEPDVAALRIALATDDAFAGVLATGRLRLCETRDELALGIAEVHQAAIADGIVSHELSGRDRNEPDLFRAARGTVQEASRRQAAEYATIRRFGVAWFTHTVANSALIERHRQARASRDLVARLDGPATVVAAGPSLDTYLESGRHLPGPLVAVDTAVPALLARGIHPTVVVSLDPQGWSVLHFRRRLPENVLLVADPGVSPRVFAAARTTLVVSSAHPLHRLMQRHGVTLPTVFAAPETVTEAAVDIAGVSGTPGTLLGADGAYPAGATYARGTYHHLLAQQRQRRLAPLDDFFARQVYPRVPLVDDADSDRPVFATSEMADARRRTEHRLATPGVPLVVPPSGDRETTVTEFWAVHRDCLRNAAARVTGDAWSTPELIAAIGSHGMAHLPVLAALRHRVRRGLGRDLPESLRRALDSGGAVAVRETLMHIGTSVPRLLRPSNI